MRYMGADWLEGKKPMSAFGRRVADMLGEWARGIYHIYGIRVALSPRSFEYLTLTFGDALSEPPAFVGLPPTLEEAVADHRKTYPSGQKEPSC